MSKSIPTDEIKAIICHRIKISAKTALEYKNDDFIQDLCRYRIQEDIELLREFDIINYDMHFDLINNKCLNMDFEYLLKVEI